MTTPWLRILLVLICLSPALGCARARMQATAAEVAGAVDQLRADIETQALIRTELARSGAERVARGEVELATRAASRAGYRARLSEADEPLLRHSQAVSQASNQASSEGADPRFAPTVAVEVERRETELGYRRHVDALATLSALLERLAEGALPSEISLYLQLGGEAAQAARDAWTRTQPPTPTLREE